MPIKPMANSEHYYVVSVGSNIEPLEHIDACRKILNDEVCLLGESTFIQTEPDGFKDQPDFINGAFYLASSLAFAEFNAYLKSVELRLGRIKGPIKAGPRTMDLDIIICDRQIVHEDYEMKDYVTLPVNQLLHEQGITLIRS